MKKQGIMTRRMKPEKNVGSRSDAGRICLSLKFFLVFCMFLLASCSSYDHGHGLSATAGAAAAAMAYENNRYADDEERLAWTAVAGLGTFAVGEMIRASTLKTMDEKYVTGYKQGEADTVKRQYELIQNIQKWKHNAARNVRVYEFPGIDHRDGVNYAPHSVKLRVEE